MGGIVRILTPEARLKKLIRNHFSLLGFKKASDGTLILPGEGKEIVRQLHGGQRAQRLADSRTFLHRALPSVLPHFANGRDIDPRKVQLRLVRVVSGTANADIFRVASLTWSVPVSVGFGRRMRYLVWDEYHGRVAGIIALGDPVYNLSARDKMIGWNVDDRAKRLVNILDAYVLGAVPPYSALLTGKAVACLVRSREVFNDFRESYGDTVGIISKEAKSANLLAVTTTSSMGRSSVYNRLRLDGTTYFDAIGYTIGWGHFHITDDIFGKMRDYLRLIKHSYADRHNFGEGPNWRLRTIKAALNEIGINQSVLRHGIQREVFISYLCRNSFSLLEKGQGKPDLGDLRTVEEISQLAKDRWIGPRAERRDDYRRWDRSQIRELISGTFSAAEEQQNIGAA